ncbi:hypothetical protein [Streptomyces sp. Wb2n-11]|uniref:hypothetical protein n=1 Tax=Streptomyces sp. Wb2n-11 TaxID=1030533 RepID=UPI000A89E92B|nr:hypothetical protein [Streptomyces sp. Wb2n-11]
MTVPEENRPKTTSTDEVINDTEEPQAEQAGGTGRTLREAMEEAGVNREDFKDQ